MDAEGEAEESACCIAWPGPSCSRVGWCRVQPCFFRLLAAARGSDRINLRAICGPWAVFCLLLSHRFLEN